MSKLSQSTTSPKTPLHLELISFDLDLDTGLLLLNFSETVDTLTFNVTQYTLQSSSNISFAAQYYSLTEQSLLTGDEVEIIQELLYFDLNSIKSLGELATSSNNTFLSVTEFAIRDMNGNRLVVVEADDALPVSTYVKDITRPLLVSFDLDMNLGILTLNFSETVNVSTLDVTEILLLNDDLRCQSDIPSHRNQLQPQS